MFLEYLLSPKLCFIILRWLVSIVLISVLLRLIQFDPYNKTGDKLFSTYLI